MYKNLKMQVINGGGKIYPISIPAQKMKKYIQRNCPCIIVFTDLTDPISNDLKFNTREVSLKHPRIFCYKVKWSSHIYYYQNIQPSDKYDITVWKSDEKLLIFNKPDFNQIKYMFDCIQNELNADRSGIFSSIFENEMLEIEFIKNLRREKLRMKKANNKSESLNGSENKIPISLYTKVKLYNKIFSNPKQLSSNPNSYSESNGDAVSKNLLLRKSRSSNNLQNGKKDKIYQK